MACRHCDYVSRNPFKENFNKSVIKTLIEVEKVKKFLETAENCFDESTTIIIQMVILFKKIYSRFLKRMKSIQELRRICGNGPDGDEAVMRAYDARLYPLKDPLMRMKIRYQYRRLEYVASCIHTYFLVKGKSFPEGKHPFLIGGIPLSKETRRDFVGTQISKHGRFTAVPLFLDEGRKARTREPLPDEYYLDHPSKPCACGSDRVNLANRYFREGAASIWPFITIEDKKREESDAERRRVPVPSDSDY